MYTNFLAPNNFLRIQRVETRRPVLHPILS
jgi:hypothetical protein